MSKIYHLSFSILQKVMLITAVHWFLIAIWHVAELNSIAIIAFAGDANSGKILYEKDARKSLSLADEA